MVNTRFWSIFFIAAAIPVLSAGLAQGQPAPRQSGPLVEGDPSESEAEVDTAVATTGASYCRFSRSGRNYHCEIDPGGPKRMSCTCQASDGTVYRGSTW
jgi:hypothetical protein